MVALTRVKRLEINEGLAARGRTEHGTLVVRTTKGATIELIPGRAHPLMDEHMARERADLERRLDSDRLSLLRYLAGSANEVPRTEASVVRSTQERLDALEKLRARQDEHHQQAWARAEEADRRAQEAARAMSEAPWSESVTLSTLLRERRTAEEQRQAAWYEVMVTSLMGTEEGRAVEREKAPEVKLKM